MKDYEPGYVIGRYQIEELIGRGGMATVYLARQTTGIERIVALKVINPEIMADKNVDTYVKRFKQEALVLASFNHPHITKLFDYGEHEGRVYLVMEYYTGGTLRDLIEKTDKEGNTLPLQTINRLVEQIGSALTYAHSRNLIHRDLKSHNVLIHENNAILSDFGIAKLLSDGTLTLTGNSSSSIGTPFYMSPEQLEGAELDARSDEYAFAVMIYEMLTGAVPFEGKGDQRTWASVVKQHLYDPPPDILKQRGDLPIEIKTVLDKALAKKPNHRYATIQDFVDNFESALAIGQESRENSRRLLVTLGAVGLIVLGLLTLGGILITRPTIVSSPTSSSTVLAIANNASATMTAALSSPTTLPPTSTIMNTPPVNTTAPLVSTTTTDPVATNLPPSATMLPSATNTSLIPSATFTVVITTVAPMATATHTLAPTLGVTTTITQTMSTSMTPTPITSTPMVQWRAGQLGQDIVDPSIETVWAPPASFQSYENSKTYCVAQGFWIDRAEVTSEQYVRFIEAGGYENASYWTKQGWEWRLANRSSVDRRVKDIQDNLLIKNPLEPIMLITWYEADAYAKWRGGRLPTVVEWEYAAGGGQRNQRQTTRFPWGNEFDTVKANLGNLRNSPVTADKIDAQTGFLNLYNMIGNVAEWAISSEDASGNNTTNAMQPVMGGAWNSSPATISVASQELIEVVRSVTQVGVRVIVPAGDVQACQ